MEIAEHLEALRRDGTALVEAAGAAGLAAEVPTCPEWRVRDLLRHVGGVHRWATDIVRTPRTTPTGPRDEAELMAAGADDDALLDWFATGHAALVQALADAGPELSCWMFLPAPSPQAFWARRQAHETAIHRADAEAAAGTTPSYPAGFAVDGIDELLNGFLGGPVSRLAADPPVALQLHATDAGRDWLIRLDPTGVHSTEGTGPHDTSVSGTASRLYLLLWNRHGADGLDVRGDPGPLHLWRRDAQIRWS